MAICAATNTKGNPCGRIALKGQEYCLFHLPKDLKVFTPPDELDAIQRELRAVQRGKRSVKGKQRTDLILALASRIAEIKEQRSRQTGKRSWQPPQA